MRKLLLVLLLIVIISSGCIGSSPSSKTSTTTSGSITSSTGTSISPQTTTTTSPVPSNSTETPENPETPIPSWDSNVTGMKAAQGIYVEVDPRTVLIEVIIRLANSKTLKDNRPEALGISPSRYQYLKDIDEYFGPYQDSRAVEIAKKLADKGMDVGDMIYFALQLDPRDFSKAGNWEILLSKNPALSEEELDEFARAVRDFAVESNFQKFYRAKKEFYGDVVQKFIEENPELEEIKDLGSSYFRTNVSSWHLVLLPATSRVVYAKSFQGDEGIVLYGALGLSGEKEGIPEFHTGRGPQVEWIPAYILWMFSNPLVEPVVEQNSEAIGKYQSLYSPVEEIMRFWGITNFREFLITTLDYVFMTHYVSSTMGPEQGEKFQWLVKSEGLYLLPSLSEVTSKEYIPNPKEYPTFPSFFPRLLNVLDTIYVETKGGEKISNAIPSPTFWDFIQSSRKSGARVIYSPRYVLEAKSLSGELELYRVPFIVKDDTNVSTEDLKGDVAIITGPKEFLYKIFEKKLPAYFNGTVLYSKTTGRHYESVAIFRAVIPNPFDEGHFIYIEVISEDMKHPANYPVYPLFHYMIFENTGLVEIR